MTERFPNVSRDGLRDVAQPVDSERHDKRLVTACRSIREKNVDSARRLLGKMHGIRMTALAEPPDFLIGILRLLENEKHLAVSRRSARSRFDGRYRRFRRLSEKGPRQEWRGLVARGEALEQ